MIALIDYLVRAAFILFFPVLIADFFVIDRLLRSEYIDAKKEWNDDGKPRGFFWVPPELKPRRGLLVSLRSSRALKSITVEWLFKTPQWMAKHEKTPGTLSPNLECQHPVAALAVL